MFGELELIVLQAGREELGYVASFAITDRMIVAAGGTSSHKPTMIASADARRWERCRTPRELGLRDVLAVGDAVWICGEYGQLAQSRDHGASWKLFETGTDVCLFALALAPDGAVWVFGDGGYAARVLGERPERVDFGTTARLAAAYPVGDRVIVLCGDGVLRIWCDGRISTIATGATRLLNGFAQSRAGTWIVVGDGGFVARSPDGQWFARAASGTEVDLEAIATLADGRLVAVGDGGCCLVSLDDGRTWKPVDTGTDAHLWAIERYGAGALIGGDGGLVARIAPQGGATWDEGVFEHIYGLPLPRELARLRVEELGLVRAALADPASNLFEQLVARGHDGLVEAFSGVFCVGARGDGDTFHAELYGWDGPRQVLHYSRAQHAFTGVVADSVEAFSSLVAAPHDPRRRDTEFMFYRSRWICALLAGDSVDEVGRQFMADFNQVVPEDQLPARFEACERLIPAALYSMWRAFVFDERELARYLEIGRAHRARLVRDAAALIDELCAGRDTLGTIGSVREHVAAFRARGGGTSPQSPAHVHG